MSKQFVYAGAVKGIQRFIFQTNHLKEIVGASELIETICTTLFKESYQSTVGKPIQEESIIQSAAGRIICIFDKEVDCRKFVKEFPMHVARKAPGVMFQQSVIQCEQGSSFSSARAQLNKNLFLQNNILIPPTEIGRMATLRSRDTGLPVTRIINEDYLDKASELKRNETSKRLLEILTNNLSKRPRVDTVVPRLANNKSFIAVLHIDGNNIGHTISNKLKNEEFDEKQYKKFSETLNGIARTAVAEAISKIVADHNIDTNKPIPFLPIIIGGDDITIICKAEYALDFTQYLLKEFESHTIGVSACAGIAFIKEKFPIYLGYKLAEALCAQTKKRSYNSKDERTASSLMFYKAQDSYIPDSYDQIVERTLSSTGYEMSFDNGPYFLDTNHNNSIETLQKRVGYLNEADGSTIKNTLREFLTLAHQSPDKAKQLLISIKDKNARGFEKLQLQDIIDHLEDENYQCPIYDWLALSTLKNN